MTKAEMLRAAELLRQTAARFVTHHYKEMHALAAKLEQMAKQEPVAWMYTHPLNETWVRLTRRMESGNDWTETPLYAAPVEIPREIRLNDDKTLDEVVGSGMFHLEQMDFNHWWMDLGGVSVWLHSPKRITATFEDRIDAALAAEQK